MVWLYNIAIWLYATGIWLVSFFNVKAKRWIDGRKDVFKQLETESQTSDGRHQMADIRHQTSDTGSRFFSKKRDDKSGIPQNHKTTIPQYHKTTIPQYQKPKTIWIHAASLGEFEQGRPIIEKLKEHFPEHKILLTFFSPSGYEIRKNYELADVVCYLPSDTKKNAERFVKTIQPCLAIFIKYEFWFHYLQTLEQRGIPTILVSAIFRPEQLFFKWYGGLFRKMLQGFDLIFVQNEASLRLLKDHGYKPVTLAGDTRVDRVISIAQQAKRFDVIENFAGGNVMVCGSTWPPDEAILIDFIKKSDNWQFIVAPHEIGESNIRRLLKILPENTIRYSKADKNSVAGKQVLVIDNIGMLSSVYRYGKLAYIGGGFGKGIHNILEPLAFGIPVVFGPKFQKFEEAVALTEKGACFSVSTSSEFEAVMTKLSNPDFYKLATEETKDYLQRNRGATEKVMEFIAGKGWVKRK